MIGWNGRRAAALTAAVLARDGYRCQMLRDGRVCGRPATTADHIIKRDQGGRHTLANLRAACAPCNFADGARYVNAKRRFSRTYPPSRM